MGYGVHNTAYKSSQLQLRNPGLQHELCASPSFQMHLLVCPLYLMQASVHPVYAKFHADHVHEEADAVHGKP